MAKHPSRSTRLNWYLKPFRIAHTHVKLLAATAAGIVLYLVLPGELRTTTRALIAWDAAVSLYLVVAFYVIARFELSHVRQRAADEDEGASLILVLTVAAAAASIAAIFAELGAAQKERASGLHVAHAVATVLLSWTFIHVIFAFHYAHEFYGEAKGGHKGGLQFPDDNRPEYWDFVYFSFVIGMTFQVSDVQVTSKQVRRLVVAHGMVSFFYNVAVLALMVNIGGEFIK
jgi:uncharacterized membrane protein